MSPPGLEVSVSAQSELTFQRISVQYQHKLETAQPFKRVFCKLADRDLIQEKANQLRAHATAATCSRVWGADDASAGSWTVVSRLDPQRLYIMVMVDPAHPGTAYGVELTQEILGNILGRSNSATAGQLQVGWHAADCLGLASAQSAHSLPSAAGKTVVLVVPLMLCSASVWHPLLQFRLKGGKRMDRVHECSGRLGVAPKVLCKNSHLKCPEVCTLSDSARSAARNTLVCMRP